LHSDVHCAQKYQWLVGSLPHFDNLRFAQQAASEDLFLHDAQLEKQISLQQASKQLGPGNEANVILGNRMNLLFVETCISKVE